MLRTSALFAAILVGLFAIELTPPAQHALVEPWTAAVARASAGVLHMVDPGVQASGPLIRSAGSGFAVTIMGGCNGIEAMIVLAAAMLAFPAPWKNRLVGILAGFAAIQLLNIVRIVSLFWLGEWDRDVFEWAHLYLWQALIMLDALIVWILWLRTLPAPAAAPA